ncbi:MAG: glutaredoxin family protein [Rhodoglobus sp.]|uniref:glutaredoxin family protein n=1 Tax=Salinibacterium sp. G-O1 TaxID=3046208 RepID=UPI0024BAE8B8|nr:glutaredoxin domain-containing protein [Salinibacterium sp. G-O1]MDJ0335074.1 glutaredoxin domain-containing protein [Salinibacterium sp. G-O1]
MTSLNISLYGADWCGDCIRAKALLDARSIDYTYFDLIATPEHADAALAISGRTNIPVITFPDGSHLVEPSNAQLEAKLTEVGAL